jgi:hypothetical protein
VKETPQTRKDKKMKKIDIVTAALANTGRYLVSETPEQFAKRHTKEDLLLWAKCLTANKEG